MSFLVSSYEISLQNIAESATAENKDRVCAELNTFPCSKQASNKEGLMNSTVCVCIPSIISILQHFSTNCVFFPPCPHFCPSLSKSSRKQWCNHLFIYKTHILCLLTLDFSTPAECLWRTGAVYCKCFVNSVVNALGCWLCNGLYSRTASKAQCSSLSHAARKATCLVAGLTAARSKASVPPSL